MSLNDQEFLKLIQELKELLEHGEKLCRKVENLFQERKDASQTYDSHENFLRSLGYTNEKLSRKVSEYHMLFEDNSFWESRQDYLKQIEMFLAGTIDGEEFSNQIIILHLKYINTAKSRRLKLKTERDFLFTSKSIGFVEVISSLFSAIDLFDSSLEDSKSSMYGWSENTLKDFVQKDILPKVRKYCDETLT